MSGVEDSTQQQHSNQYTEHPNGRLNKPVYQSFGVHGSTVGWSDMFTNRKLYLRLHFHENKYVSIISKLFASN
jgi:hypothetical protein